MRNWSISPREDALSLLPMYCARSGKVAEHFASSAAVGHHSQRNDHPRKSSVWGRGSTLVHQEPVENPWQELSAAESSVTPPDWQIFALRFPSLNADSTN